ncbi:hypothetical protein A3A14_00410 [Candidatus Daviesbacteria bacterium RIFCSPLOWO2_01_FULL_43_38]|uniref:Glycosyltransferase RgtA/B/C/D-like domain-containing protein n=2 Tax=Candidatus Daviesiibacteriota TaxID=1752718 RepID=A0A1F5K8W2_9BACT|nr:MAG: hypothetical protein UV33_C0032G0005 [Candidatus Daviesbacteria bacterium GW2011_GWA1_42_6]OGE20579.1 MAG: hypothetical protein A2874_02595 [Candidatus Daviesbacteria bacterium RIFCSPHIGHO2_01_FULL_43_17]OGE37081.1 MAG: hypothetical protein A3E45_02195 [Candidatus Daviesbacteria bacterium RIFCSPHIGHO2_12_FULL_43_11]OGE63994.1 MAG: hypothetical protein A3A14_00410 [Candidatus Daviesbacteria bacterium RIFCSPLOWO2_01_FULL_43_38]OGE70609.1 MAG: hypothetical protein A3J21_00410 [Candidatus D
MAYLFKKRSREFYLLAAITILSILFSFILWQKLSFIQHSHFSDLAFSFLQGQLSLSEPLRYTSWQDSAAFGDKFYVYFGPVPSLLLLPLIAIFGQTFNQQFLTLFLGLVNFYLLFKLAGVLGLKSINALWLTLAIIFGSVYIFLTLVNISAYLIQVAGFTFLTAALFEFYTKKRWLLIGVLLALAGLTRQSLYFGTVFFVIELILSKDKFKYSHLVLLLQPIILSIAGSGFYNFLRFGNFFDNGYAYNTTFPDGVKEAVRQGMFSLVHIPGNLYFLLLKGPEAVRVSEVSFVLKYPFLKASEWGMGIFFTSPFFFYLFRSNLRDHRILVLLIGAIIGIIPALTYAGVGVWQYGYRYALDIYPFLFIILASVFVKDKVTTLAKTVIIYSLLFNLYMLGSIWNIYPFS